MPADKKPERSYLTSAVESINPWASSRAATPAPDASRLPPLPKPADHSTTPLYGQSLRSYPHDCPPLNVQWFHAVDVCSGPSAPSVLSVPITCSAVSPSPGAEAEAQARP